MQAMAIFNLIAALPNVIFEKVFQGGFWATWTIILQREAPRNNNLLNLAIMHRGQRCKLDQDRIYANLAMVSDGPAKHLEIITA
jgi:hypothetical protein